MDHGQTAAICLQQLDLKQEFGIQTSVQYLLVEAILQHMYTTSESYDGTAWTNTATLGTARDI